MFIVNLAISDLCMITTQGLPVSVNIVLEDHFMYGAFMCQIYACIGGIFGNYFCQLLLWQTVKIFFYKSYHYHGDFVLPL